jgi:K+-sensing histidine kinase KdpD
MRLLRTLAALTTLALDRSRLFVQERDARVALEKADEIKTNFIALAAHELRTPAATVHGLVETIRVGGPGLWESLRDDRLARPTSASSCLRAPDAYSIVSLLDPPIRPD